MAINVARKRRSAGICLKLRKEKIKFESYLATYRFYPSDMGPRKKFERKKMTRRNDSDDSARLRIDRQNFLWISVFSAKI